MTLLPMENRESILGALKSFGKEKSNTIPLILEDYIKQIARTGQTMLPWIYIKPLLLRKFNKVVDNLASENDSVDFFPLGFNVTEFKQRVHCSLKHFNGIPFTIQRICELLENPHRHYSRVDKFLRGFEKVCMIVTTVDPEGNKIRSEDPRYVSRAGLDECNATLSNAAMSPPVSSPGFDELQPRHHIPKSSDEEDEEEVTDEDDNDDTDILSENATSPGTDKSSSSNNQATNSPTGLRRIIKSPPPMFGECLSNGISSASIPQQQHLTSSPTRALSSPPAVATFGKSEIRFLPDDDDSSPASSNEDLVKSDEETSSEIGSSPNQLDVVESRDMDELVNTNSHADITSPPTTTVPSIGEILRPIGQLEAFVQNLSADVSSTTSLPSLLGNLTSETEIDRVDEEPQTSDHVHPLITGIKRPTPSSSPSSVEGFVNNPDHMMIDTHEASPAKRRRFSDSPPPPPPASFDLEGERSVATPPIMSPTTLNNSPPIIICGTHLCNRTSELELQPVLPDKSDAMELCAPEASSPEPDTTDGF